jgi:hypothetical protein
MLRWYYSVDASTVLEITDRVRKPGPSGEDGLSVGSHAEEGSGWEGSINVDDELGDFVPLMHRRIYAVQDAAPSGNQVVGNWFITGLDVIRGTPPVEASRIWQISMADENSLLSRRIMQGPDSIRPAETDIERILWLLTTTELNTLSPDVTYIDQTGPVDMDAAPDPGFTGQKPEQIISDCSQASGKNYWVKYEEAAAVGGAIVSSSIANPTVLTTTTAHGLVTGQQVTIAGHSGSTPDINGTHTVTVTGGTTFTIPVNVTVGGTGGTTSTVGRYVLCYFNANSSDLYPSAVGLSNVETEIDDSTIFAITDDSKLNRAGGRSPVSGMYLPFTGGYVYEQDTDVGDTYVYRDVSAPAVNVKTAAKATARAQRLLAELDEPDDEVEAEIIVDEAHLNDAMHGMLIPLRATHFPNYTEDGTQPGYSQTANLRIMRRQIRQIGPTKFGNRMWMTPTSFLGLCNGLQPRTPAGFYPNIGINAASWPNPADSAISDATGNVFAIVGGSSTPDVPTPFYDGNWGFPLWNIAHGTLPSGSYDTAWSNAGNSARCLVIGPGTMTIYLVPGPEGVGEYDWLLYTLDGVSQTIIDGDEGLPVNPTGITELVVEVPTEVPGITGPLCNFWVDVVFQGAPAARDVGFGGFTWVPAP